MEREKGREGNRERKEECVMSLSERRAE